MRASGWPFLVLALSFSAVTGVLAPACSGDGACSEQTCGDGCCGADGVCRESSPQSCGLAGARCDDCTSRRLGCFEGVCQTYQQQCLPLESNCSVDEACCSQICSRGLCSEARCRTGAAACETGTECCSGICENELCTQSTCGEAGSPCGPSEGCCAPLICGGDGLCVPPCKGAGAACATGDECCTQLCEQGACVGNQQTCGGLGEVCAVDPDCCGNYICVGGSCGN